MSNFFDWKSKLLHEAAENPGGHDAVKGLLDDPEVEVNYTFGAMGLTPFMRACRDSDAEKVRIFLESRREINYNHRDIMGRIVLHRGMSGDPVFRMLLDDPRIDVNDVSSRGASVLMSRLNNIDRVKRILATGRFTQIHAVSERGNSALSLVVASGMNVTADIIRAHIEDPVASTRRLREELGGYPEYLAGELFAIIVLLCDGYLSPPAPAGAPSPLALEMLEMPMGAFKKIKQ